MRRGRKRPGRGQHMILYRFMSQSEYDKYCSGKVLSTRKNHSRRHRTGSRGFCFLSKGEWDSFTAEEASWFLRGIVSGAVLCYFECKNPEEAGVRASWGTYSVPYEMNPDAGWGDTMKVREYCTTSYSRDTLRLLKTVRAPFSRF